jgi:DNA polymerase III alpha subunit (gram-positive type)
MRDLNNWPRVTQLAWAVWDDEKQICAHSSLIKPDGWEVPKTDFFIKNNMSTERCEKEGMIMQTILDKFIADIAESGCQYLIAHNINFDYNVLGSEMIRYKKTTGKAMKQICTMHASTEYCKLPGNFGYKWPKLEELHNKLFGCPFEGAHDALFDVRAMVKCFFELKKIGVIKWD